MSGSVRGTISVVAASAVLAGTAWVCAPIAGAAPSSAGLTAQAGSSYQIGHFFVSPSLLALRAQVDARWPGRSRASDGAVGDIYHARSRSEHNPVGSPHGPVYGTPGAVHALDITSAGISTSAVLDAVVGDPRVWYVIYAGRIWSRTYGWRPMPYFGDPHFSHIHISLASRTQREAVWAENSTGSWFGSGGSSSSTASNGLKPGARGEVVAAMQRALIKRGFAIPNGPTGFFGDQTRAAVRAFQRAQGWRGAQADGIPGPGTLQALSLSISATLPPARAVPATPRAAAAGIPKFGDRGAAVQRLQRALLSRGLRIPSGPTGWFGPETRKAVKKFQRSQGWRGIYADGVPGPATMARLGLR